MVPKAFSQFLIHFHGDRDYFECHEILEEYWKEVDPGNKDSIWVGFIQLAVSSYHYRRGNLSGALRTLDKSSAILKAQKQQCHKLGIDHGELIQQIKVRRERIVSQTPYMSMMIPINNHSLLNHCIKECEKHGLSWGRLSNNKDETLINKHALRDRTDVILERKLALENRKNKRQ